MPEGDAVFRFARKVGEALTGRQILAARSHGPGPVPQVERIVGATCTGTRAQGKNLFISFDNGFALRGHLRMYGTWHVYAPGEPWRLPEREARLVLETRDSVVVNFSAPVIELIREEAIEHHRPIATLGPDLLAEDFDAREALRRFRMPDRANLTLGDAIMDQTVMAGVGNIWKHETLYRCAFNPWRRVAELTDDELRQVIDKARELLMASVGALERNGRPVPRPLMFVYANAGKPCRRCSTIIRSAPQGIDIRSTAWCPKCQPVAPNQAVQPPPPRRSRGTP